MSDYSKADHLAMIQGVINRMGTNAGMMKAAAVGIVAGFAALASTAGRWPLVVAIVPVAVACWMDASYLRLERLYRHLYDAARKAKEETAQADPYSMVVKPWLGERDVQWFRVFASWSVWLFYSVLAALTLGGAAFVSPCTH